MGWQTALCATAYSAALAVQGMIALTVPGYSALAWHGVLLTVCGVIFTIFFSEYTNSDGRSIKSDGQQTRCSCGSCPRLRASCSSFTSSASSRY